MDRRTQPNAPASREHRGSKHRLARLAAVSAVAAGLVVSTAQSAFADASADSLAAAIAGPGITISGSSFVVKGGPQAVQVRSDSVAGFPADTGGSYATFSTGDASILTNPNSAPNSGTSLGAPPYRGTRDTTTLKIDFNVQPGFNCLSSIKFRFLSEEYPEFVGSQFNDALLIELDADDWSLSGTNVVAPHNIAFAGSDPITINATGPLAATAAEAAGTTFDAATSILSARSPITPGAHSLYITIFDQGDSIYDSMALIDDLRAAAVADPAAECPAGAFATNVNPPNRFVPLTPARIVDSRIGLGVASKVTAATSTPIQVTGLGGVPPAGVSAAVLNVTVTEPDFPGFVRVTPSGTTSFVSNLNVEHAGETLPNLVTVPVSADGKVDFFSQAGTHVIVDVFGYYTAAAASTSGRFIATDPTRLLDTRAAIGVPGTSVIPAGGQIDVQMTGRAPVPATGVSAVVLNVTATASLGVGYITAWPTGISRPPTSNLNIENVGQSIPNQVVVPVGPTGMVSFYSNGGGHLIADVAGYFTDTSAPQSSVGLFIPISPARLLDTRDATGVPGTTAPGAGQTVDVTIAGRGGVPAFGASAIVGNLTATESAAPGYVTAFPTGIAPPSASNLNLERAGQTIANHTTVRINNGGVSIFTQSGTHLLLDVSGFYTS